MAALFLLFCFSKSPRESHGQPRSRSSFGEGRAEASRITEALCCQHPALRVCSSSGFQVMLKPLLRCPVEHLHPLQRSAQHFYSPVCPAHGEWKAETLTRLGSCFLRWRTAPHTPPPPPPPPTSGPLGWSLRLQQSPSPFQ